MRNNGKELYILGFVLIIIGILIIPDVAVLIFGLGDTCYHKNIYLAGLAIILIGIGFVYFVWKKKNE